MKHKRIVPILVVMALIVFAISSFAEVTKLKTIGRYTFARVKGNIPTQEVMQTVFDRYAADIKLGFEMAGYADLYLPFLDEMKSGPWAGYDPGRGRPLMWMLFRNQGKVKVTKEIEWAGKAPLAGLRHRRHQGLQDLSFHHPQALRQHRPEEHRGRAAAARRLQPGHHAREGQPQRPHHHRHERHAERQEHVDRGLRRPGEQGGKPEPDAGFPEVADQVRQARRDTFQGERPEPAGTSSLTTPARPRPTSISRPSASSGRPACPARITWAGRSRSTPPAPRTRTARSSRPSSRSRTASGAVIDTFTKTDKPFLWEKIFQKAGLYAISTSPSSTTPARFRPPRTPAASPSK